ncbi:MAG: hypothetical protein RL141_225 [Candidatus Parcubacteria bacterium]|jgi:hypothetical protein
MKRLTKAQKQALFEMGRFWAVHTGHWVMAAVFMAFTLGILYTFWGNDAAFAAVMFGE